MPRGLQPPLLILSVRCHWAGCSGGQTSRASFPGGWQKPQRHPCAGIDGLIEEYSTFVRDERPEASVLDVFASEAALKVEHYEIVAYKGLIELGRQLRLGDEVNLLRESLKEEEQTAQSLERLSKSLGQAMPNGEDMEDQPGSRRAKKKR